MNRLIIWGAGELGGRVARMWYKGAVIGATETTKRHVALQRAGITPIIGSPIKLLKPDDLLLLALPGHLKQKAAIESLAEVEPPARSVLISSTGYYGPTPSGIIHEDSPPGSTERAARIALTEELFLAWAGKSGVIVRLGGLYRLGRGPMPALARRGAPLRRAPDKTLALIHYDDAAVAVKAALELLNAEQTYLGVTPPCPTRRTFYELACQKLALPAPDFAPLIGLPPAQYDVTRLRRDLLPQSAHPDWREALEL